MNLIKSTSLALVLGVCLVAPAALRAEDAATKPKPYTLKNCIVSGDKLGEMGDAFVYIYKDPKVKNDPGHEIKFCCKSCLKDFNKDPQGYLKKIDLAEAKERK